MIRVKLHLTKGAHYRQFQVKDLRSGDVEYVNPETQSLCMVDCVLKNRKKTAQRIFDGANREVCAWVECDMVQIVDAQNGSLDASCKAVLYNPKVAPYFCDVNGNNLDGFRFPKMVTVGRTVFSV